MTPPATRSALNRRDLMLAGGAVVVSFAAGGPAVADQDAPAHPALTRAPAEAALGLPGSLKDTPFLDSWLAVRADGGVTIFTGKVELGQGIKTALIQIAAEELDVPAGRIELVTADTARTPNETFTSGSHSLQDSGTAIMYAAAQARSMLLDLAAERLAVERDRLRTADAAVVAPDGRTVSYGALAEGVSLHVQAEGAAAFLKDASRYRLIGRPMARVDIPAKVTGAAAYVQDMRLPGMLHARVVRPPSYGAKLKDFEPGPVEAMPGVVSVVRQGDYLAVVAATEWQAVKAQRTLQAAAAWTETAHLPDPSRLYETLAALPARDIVVDHRQRPAGPGVRRFKSRFTRPYLAHGSIGPSCAVAVQTPEELTIWTHSQGVFPLRGAIAQLLRETPGRVRCVHAEGSGCYGHNGADDVAMDAAIIARSLPGRAVRVQLMRDQEQLWDPFGPAMIGEVEAALDGSGAVVDWRYAAWSNTHTTRPVDGGFLAQNTMLPNPLPTPAPQPIPMPEGGGDRNSIPIYAFPNSQVVNHFIPAMPVRVSALRSLGAYLNVFSIESFMDELAQAAGADPVQFRLRHLEDGRAKAVIERAATRFGWRAWKPAAERSGRGFAFARYKNLAAYCAVALDLTVDPKGGLHIGRVVAAVDAGQTVNPDGLRNQIEGAIIQSISWTLLEEVRFDQQRITSANWASYPILRFPMLPQSVEIEIIDRPGLPFLGAGECGQGPTAAAIANALGDATGTRLRQLPLRAERISAGPHA